MTSNERLVAMTLDAALAYADRGWRVFPLRPDDKRPACPTHSASDCDRSDVWCADGHTGWEARATTDTTRITRAWSSTSRSDRRYGIGIATGPSNLVVIDLDQPKPGETTPPPGWNLDGVRDGHDVLAIICERAGQPVPWDTFTVRTGRGGTHLYFKASPDIDLRNTSSSLGWLVDTRAGGGYVVAAPSTVAARPYTVIDGSETASLPLWLAEALAAGRGRPAPIEETAPSPRHAPFCGSPDRYVEAAIAGEVRRIAAATPGQRNHSLFLAAVAVGQLVGAGAVPEHAAHATLLAASADHIATGAFTAAEADATIRSGLPRGIAEPRHLPGSRATDRNRGAA